MKKVNYLITAMILALCVGFTSCSDDDDDTLDGFGHLEITINGTTYRQSDPLGVSFGHPWNQSLMRRAFGIIDTPELEVNIELFHYRDNTSFQNAETGEFRVGDLFQNSRNLDLNISIWCAVENSPLWYEVVDGKHTVSNIRLLSTNALTYLVEGTFSASLRLSSFDGHIGEVIEISGRYWTKIFVRDR